jgi:surface polysaccharide O-acyltransferase-like enzyme
MDNARMDENPYKATQHGYERKARGIVGCLLTFVLLPISLFIAFFATCTSVTVGLIQILRPPIDEVAWFSGPLAGLVVVFAIVYWKGKWTNKRTP